MDNETKGWPEHIWAMKNIGEHYCDPPVSAEDKRFLRKYTRADLTRPAPDTRADALREALDTADAVKDAVVDMLPFTDGPPLRSQCLTLADAISEFEKARAASDRPAAEPITVEKAARVLLPIFENKHRDHCARKRRKPEDYYSGYLFAARALRALAGDEG